MATKIMDTLKNRLQSPQGQQPAGGVEDQTQRTQSLLRAKLGKASQPGAQPRMSNIREQQAAQQARMGQERLQREGQVAGQQLKQQERAVQVQEQEQMADIGERQQDLQAQYARQADAMLQQFQREGRKLQDRRDAAQAEQLGHQIRFQNRDYITSLQREAATARLDNEAEFREQLARQQFKDMEQVFRDQQAYSQLANASQREFNEMMNQIQLDDAVQMAEEQRQAEIERAPWIILGGATTAGTAAAGSGNIFKSGGDGGETGGTQ